jgi:hypothetical protein
VAADTKKPERYILIARAKSAHGSVQPANHDQNYGGYVINHPLSIKVVVLDSERESAGTGGLQAHAG